MDFVTIAEPARFAAIEPARRSKASPELTVSVPAPVMEPPVTVRVRMTSEKAPTAKVPPVSVTAPAIWSSAA